MHTVHHDIAQHSPALSVKPHLAVAQLQALHKANQLLRRVCDILTQKVAAGILHTPQQRQQRIAYALSSIGMSATLVTYALKLFFYNIIICSHIFYNCETLLSILFRPPPNICHKNDDTSPW